MKSRLLISAAALLIATSSSAQSDKSGYPITPVPFTSVKVAENSFWGQRLHASKTVTIPLAFSKCEETGRYTNFSNAHQHILDPKKTFPICGDGAPWTFSFDDTDPYKTIEGASYLLQTYPDKKLEAYVDSVIAVIASGQEPDGYLYTSRTQNPTKPHPWAGSKRWERVEDLSHEFYNLGHLCEAAVAHYYATGKRNLLDVCIRYADVVCKEVGPNKGQAHVVPGHQIAEMGLAKLYIATGNKKYLDEAQFFLDTRGTKGSDWMETNDGFTDADGYYHRLVEYSQAHKPVWEQDEAVGHAVRAGYMYAGMADVAALTGNKKYIDAIDKIWENIVSKKYYITGGVGATSNGEAFGKNYELPNMSAYCETCAAIANVYLNYRLFLLHGESKYYDVLERTLYNGVISGISIDGGKFFYPNPLQSMGQHQRQAWFGCACCPSNAARFIPSLPQYIYAVDGNKLYVNLFNSNTVTVKVNNKPITLTQDTKYPYDGDINITINKTSGQYALYIRIPGWVRNEVVPSDLYWFDDLKRLSYSVKVNGQTVTSELKDGGYFVIDRKWKAGDKVSVHLDMEARIVRANGNVLADKGRVSVERGPLVYCAEWPDNTCDVLNVLLNRNPKFTLGEKQIENTEIKTITTDAQTLAFNDNGKLTVKDEKLVLIPYYAWAHRGSGQMTVWYPIELNATSPTMPPSIASKAKIESSQSLPSLSSINDRLVPADGNDRSVPYIHYWPKNGGTEWISYHFDTETEVSSSTVYWFDDSPWGGCTVPKAWKLYYKDSTGEYVEVKHATGYPSQKGVPCTVQFDPVKTTSLKLEITLPDAASTGLFEWEVK